jgi:translation initiation factor IF-3
MFRGREIFHPELGLKILERIAEQVSDHAIVESAPRQDGRNMTMVLHPHKGSRRPKGGSGGQSRSRAPRGDGGAPAEVAEPAEAVEPVSAATEESGAA